MTVWASYGEVHEVPPSVLAPPTADPWWLHSASVEVPIVIDFGSSHVRAGFSNQDDPFLDFPSLFVKYQLPSAAASSAEPSNGGASPSSGGDEEAAAAPTTAVGNDALYIHPTARKNSPFDLNVPYHFGGVELLLDHAFSRLLTNNCHGCAESPYSQTVAHPVVMTEPPLMPRYSRGLLLQLLFEGYDVPAATLGLDALFALYADHQAGYVGALRTDWAGGRAAAGASPFHAVPQKTVDRAGRARHHNWVVAPADARPPASGFPEHAVVICSGYESSHVLIVSDGRLRDVATFRLNVGGHHATEVLNAAVQLRHSALKPAWNHVATAGPSSAYVLAEAVKREHGLVAMDYDAALKSFQAAHRANLPHPQGRKIQLPFDVALVVPVTDAERTERERNRALSGDRIRAMQLKRRVNKFRDFWVGAMAGAFEDDDEKRRRLRLEPTSQKTVRRQLLDLATGKVRFEEGEAAVASRKQVPFLASLTRTIDDALAMAVAKGAAAPRDVLRHLTDTGLVEEGDLELDPEAHAALVAWGRRRAAIVAQELAAKKATSSDGGGDAAASSSPPPPLQSLESIDPRRMSLESLQPLRDRLAERLERAKTDLMHARSARLQLEKSQVSTIAESMRLGAAAAAAAATASSSNAAATPPPPAFSSRPVRGGGKARALIAAAQTVESDAPDQDDDDFLASLRQAASVAANTETAWWSAAAQAEHARLFADVEVLEESVATDTALLDLVDTEITSRLDPGALHRRATEKYQVTLDVERIRGPETIFQPSILGSPHQGLVEATLTAMARGEAAKLAKLVYICGGNSAWANLGARLHAELLAQLPAAVTAGGNLRVFQTGQATWGPWRGARRFANDAAFQDAVLKRWEYEEHGGERAAALIAARHFASNRT